MASINNLRKQLVTVFVTVSLSLMVTPVAAGTIVRVSTTMGDFSMELLDDVAPVTVENFLNYVNRNAYNGNYFHRVVDNFVAQTGGYGFEPFVGPIDVETDPPIVNEFNVSNQRGTVAMAKLDGAPNSATSQWFVNLEDNSSLDTTNGGFTVFGTVLGEGMEVLDSIDDLGTVSLGFKAPSTPFVTEAYSSPLDFVYMTAEVTQRFSSAPHVFESATGLLITSVDIDNGSEFISINFNAVADTDQVIIQANLDSVISRRDSYDGIATFSSSDNKLRIPTLEANLNGNVVLVNNVVFGLTSTNPVQFTLESFDQ